MMLVNCNGVSFNNSTFFCDCQSNPKLIDKKMKMNNPQSFACVNICDVLLRILSVLCNFIV